MLAVDAEAITILDLSTVLFPSNHGGARRVLMLAAYFDESASPTGSMAVAGFLSDTRSWYHDFDVPWRRALAKRGLESFHMTDFESRLPPFDKLDNDERIDLLTELAAIIGHSTPVGFATAIVLDAYHALSSEDQGYFGSPYEFCAFWCACKLMRDWLRSAGVTERVAVVFEAGARRQGRVVQVINEAIEKWGKSYHIVSVTSASKGDFSQFQAADFLAYESPKQSDRHRGAEARPIRKSLMTLLGHVEVRNAFFGAKELDELKKEIDAYRASLRASTEG